MNSARRSLLALSVSAAAVMGVAIASPSDSSLVPVASAETTADPSVSASPSPTDSPTSTTTETASPTPTTTETATPTPTPTASPAPTYTPPELQVMFTDPVRNPHGISDQLVRLIDNTPAGQSIEISTYFLGSERIERSLERAFARGTQVRIILSGSTKSQYPQGPRLEAVLNANKTDASWLRWTVGGSARGTSGINHQKVYRFSKVGTRTKITVVGSMNSSDLADSRAYSQMLLNTNSDVYARFQQNFAEATADRAITPNPLRQYAASAWNLYFLPTTTKYASADPVIKRLNSIPANSGTTIKIAMFSQYDTRGQWIANKLASMARSGAKIYYISGQSVSANALKTMRDAGVHIHYGCFSDGTFTHSKDMSATYVRDGVRQYWAWIGSDNWNTNGQDSDEAVLGVKQYAVYSAHNTNFSTVWNRPGGVSPSNCVIKTS